MVFRQGQLKGQVYNIEHLTSSFYNLTKPLTRQDLLPYQVYVPWSWEAKPTRIAAADGVEQPRSCKEAKDFDEIPTFSAVYDHSCNPDSTFLLVAMYKSICVCGCQWGVYASTWPIKKKKRKPVFESDLIFEQGAKGSLRSWGCRQYQRRFKEKYQSYDMIWM